MAWNMQKNCYSLFVHSNDRMCVTLTEKQEEQKCSSCFYAHGHPEELCQHALTCAWHASRGRMLFPTRLHTDVEKKHAATVSNEKDKLF